MSRVNLTRHHFQMERLLLKPARRLQKPRAVFTGGFGLTCTSCQHHAFLKSSRVRGFTTEPTTESLNESPNEFLAASSTGPFLPDTNFDRTPFYVTTPIFYVNAGQYPSKLRIPTISLLMYEVQLHTLVISIACSSRTRSKDGMLSVVENLFC